MRILKVDLTLLESFGEALLFKCIKPDAVVHHLLLGLRDIFKIAFIEFFLFGSCILCKLHLLLIKLLRRLVGTG